MTESEVIHKWSMLDAEELREIVFGILDTLDMTATRYINNHGETVISVSKDSDDD